MSTEVIQNQIQTPSFVDWETSMPPTDLIFDDGEPLESNRHRIAMNVLIRSLQQAWVDREDYFVEGWLWCETLGFWLGIGEGTIERETAPWLRFYHPEGNLVLLPEEAERQRAERLAARLRELGENPENL